MLIGICGGICSGKKTVAHYLINHHGFKHLYLKEEQHANAGEDALTREDSDMDPTTNKAHVINGSQALRPQPTRSQSILSPRPPPPEHSFSTPEALLDFVTKHWRDKWVTTTIPNEAALDLFTRRPFFILISVDAPVTVRWRRHQARQARQRHQSVSSASSSSLPPTFANGSAAAADDDHHHHDSLLTLEAFVTQSDTHLYDPYTGLQQLIARATVRLLNTSTDLAHLYATLGKLDLANEDRLRPTWDSYFMSLAALAAHRSNCMKRRVGCVLVGPGRRVISTGYNGTPRGLTNCAEGGCGRCNAASGSGVGLATCLCIHAEENALLEAGRERIREGAVLYCDTCPCLTCSIKICQVGISEVVYAHGYSMDAATAEVFREAGVRLRQFIPPPNGLIHLEKSELY